MARFLVLNFEDFGLNQDITKTIQSQTLFCICCLDKNIPLIDLKKCCHSSFLDLFLKPEINLYKHVICSHCHGMLKKIEYFKEQVQESFSLLSTESFSPSETSCVRKIKLSTKKAVDVDVTAEQLAPETTSPQCQPTEKTIELVEEHSMEVEPIRPKKPTPPMKPKLEKKKKKSSGDLKSLATVSSNKSMAEVKIEFEPGDGGVVLSEPADILCTPELPLSEYEIDVIPQTAPLKQSKIITVTLTKDELMRERVLQAQSKMFLRCPYRCENCIIGFHYEENVIDHMIRRHGPKVGSVTCEICLQVLFPAGSLNAHNFRHYTRYDCCQCGQRYPTFDDALAHYRKLHKHKDSAFKCRLCKFTTSNYSNLKIHKISQHHKFSCKYCGMMMSSATNLTKHLGTIHKKLTLRPEPELAYCEQCSLQFKTSYALNLHLTKSLAHIPRDDKYTCDECGMKFASVKHLRMHMEAHGNCKTYKCDHCPMEFTLELEMLEHIEGKHVERSRVMICDLCGRAYKNRHFFLRHMSVHNVMKRKLKRGKIGRRKKI